MADEAEAAAAAELTLTQKLEAALAEIAALKAAAAGPPPPPPLNTLADNLLMAKFLEGVHILLGSHPLLDEVWNELHGRLVPKPAEAPKP